MALTKELNGAVEREIQSIDLDYPAALRAQNGKNLKDSFVHAHIVDVEKSEVTSSQYLKLLCPLHLKNQLPECVSMCERVRVKVVRVIVCVCAREGERELIISGYTPHSPHLLYS